MREHAGGRPRVGTKCSRGTGCAGGEFAREPFRPPDRSISLDDGGPGGIGERACDGRRIEPNTGCRRQGPDGRTAKRSLGRGGAVLEVAHVRPPVFRFCLRTPDMEHHVGDIVAAVWRRAGWRAQRHPRHSEV